MRKSVENSAPTLEEILKETEREGEKAAQKKEKETKNRAKKVKVEERERKAREAKEARMVRRKVFDFEREKPEVLKSIVSASQASSNLVNALMVS